MNTKTKALSESALITALICVLGLAGMYIPLLGLILNFIYTPLIVIGKRHGSKYMLIALVAASLIMGIFAGPIRALSLLLLSGLSSAVMGSLLHAERRPAQVLGAGILAAIVGSIVMLGVTQLATGIPVAETMRALIEESSNIQQSMNDVLKTDQETADRMHEIMARTGDMMVLLIPAIIIMSAILSTFVSYWLATVILRRIHTYIPPLPPFREFALPRSVLLGTVIIYGLSLAASALGIVDEEVLMTNVQMLMMYTFAAQGLAVAIWYMHRRSVSRFLRVFTILFALFSSIGVLVLFMLGIADSAFRIRARAAAQ